MKGYLVYQENDAYLFVGKRLLGADIDRPIGEMALADLDLAALKNVDELLIANGYEATAARVHLVCDHSD
jgi:hypothetical protein